MAFLLDLPSAARADLAARWGVEPSTGALYEAMTALRSIITETPGHLERCGWLLLEHGYDQAASVGEALVARGFARVRSHRDLAGHERLTEAQWI